MEIWIFIHILCFIWLPLAPPPAEDGEQRLTASLLPGGGDHLGQEGLFITSGQGWEFWLLTRLQLIPPWLEGVLCYQSRGGEGLASFVLGGGES